MYKSHSPWSKTSILYGRVLDIQTKRNLFRDPLDEYVSIPQQFDKRPDLFSFEKYGTAKYWWIFAQRNPDDIIDPIDDFTAGKKIYVPNRTNIDKMR
jgi:hypothetical protein